MLTRFTKSLVVAAAVLSPAIGAIGAGAGRDRRPAGRADADRPRRPPRHRDHPQQYRRGGSDLSHLGRIPADDQGRRPRRRRRAQRRGAGRAGDDPLRAAPGDAAAAPAAVDPHLRPRARRAWPTANIASICCSARFRKPRPVAKPGEESPRASSISLTPIYGVTIPVIVRLGNLSAKAGHRQRPSRPSWTASRRSRSTCRAVGDRSTFGEVRVLKPGVKIRSPSRARSRSTRKSRRAR